MKTPQARSGRAPGAIGLQTVAAQRRAAVHRHGRDGGRRGAGGAGAQASSTWRWASRARRAPRARSTPSSARSTARRSATRWRWACRELRARIAGHYRQRYGVDVAPERVVVTTGSSAAFVLAFLALFDAGAKVALPSPGYPCYRHILTALGQSAGPAHAPMPPRAGCRPRARSSEAAAREGVAGLVIASPANPTGTMLEGSRLAEIVAACRRHEHLAGLRRDLPRPDLRPAGGDGAGAQTSDAIVVNSFSKYFSMTGWRVGWLVVPQELVRPDRAAGAEPLHLAADRGPGRGHRRLRRHRGARGQQARLRREPRAAAGRASQGRARAHRARRRRLLPLRRRRRLHVRQRRLHQGDAATKSASPPRRASTSMPSAAAATCASATPARRRTWPKPRAGCRAWSRLRTRG